MKQKKIVAMFLAVTLIFSGCGEQRTEENKATPLPTGAAKYREVDFYRITEEELVEYNGEPKTRFLQRDMTGRPALYVLEAGRDDTEKKYGQILEYALTGKGEWEMKVICSKSLTKRIKNEENAGISMKYIVRGDDGNRPITARSGIGFPSLNLMRKRTAWRKRGCSLPERTAEPPNIPHPILYQISGYWRTGRRC